MNRVAIVQARAGSARLPGKVLADLVGRPMLGRQLERLLRCGEVDEIVVATTTQSIDDPVVTIAESAGVRWFRGDEQDVLSRFVGAARESGADVVIRSTADCPLIDPGIVDWIVRAATDDTSADYTSNVIRRTYPRGLDVEVMFSDVLERIARLAQTPAAREHVTTFVRAERPDLFVIRSLEDSADNSDLSWTVDTPEDLARVRTMYERLGLGDRIVPYREMLAFVRSTLADAL